MLMVLVFLVHYHAATDSLVRYVSLRALHLVQSSLRQVSLLSLSIIVAPVSQKQSESVLQLISFGGDF